MFGYGPRPGARRAGGCGWRRFAERSWVIRHVTLDTGTVGGREPGSQHTLRWGWKYLDIELHRPVIVIEVKNLQRYTPNIPASTCTFFTTYLGRAERVEER